MILSLLQLQVPSLAPWCPTQTYCSIMLSFALCHTVIIKCKFFSIWYISYRSHNNLISSIHNLNASRAIRKTWMAEPRGISSFDDRINDNHLNSCFIILMSFKSYVIKVRKILWELIFVLTLLDYILLFKPSPRWIYFTKIFHNKPILLDSFFLIANHSKPFWMNLKLLVKLISVFLITV